MLKKRIIATLLTDGMGNCVKPTGFCRPYRMCGPLIQHVKVMNARNIDELIIIDINAAKEDRSPYFDAINSFTDEAFMPVVIGGGISSIESVDILIRYCGADKVLLGRGINDPLLVANIAGKYGEQAIVAALDLEVNYCPDKITVLNNLPIGEVIVTAKWKEHTYTGYDLDSIRYATRHLNVPVVANGGCGEPKHMVQAFDAGADGAASGSMFMFTKYTPADCSKWIRKHSGHKVRPI